jgi:hypothetical protein
MEIAKALWSDNPPEGQDYFDETRLGTLYSKAFVETYREAAKYPIYDEGGGPFGYDVITNSQDGCPLEDVAIVPAPAKDGMTDVKVTFRLWGCAGDDEALKKEISEVHFDVVSEGGKPVIADIHRIVDGKADSLIAEMKDIAKEGAAAPVDEPPPTAETPADAGKQVPENPLGVGN